MFNDRYGLTQAVLDGRKTQTRRIITPQPTFKGNLGICWKGYAYGLSASWDKLKGCYRNFVMGTEYDKSCKRLRKGEVVAVAQSYKDAGVDFIEGDVRNGHNHLWGNTKGMKGWNNKMFVLPEAMPHQIRITNVRIEKLQDISEKDAIAEGVAYAGLTYEDYGEPMFVIDGCKQTFGSARDAYAWIIDKINSKGTWQSNPYVFVYDFELIK